MQDLDLMNFPVSLLNKTSLFQPMKEAQWDMRVPK